MTETKTIIPLKLKLAGLAEWQESACGCRIHTAKDGGMMWEQCPTHAAAPRLLAALEAFPQKWTDFATMPTNAVQRLLDNAATALAAARGE